MSTNKEQEEINLACLKLEHLSGVAKAVTAQVDSFLNEQGADKAAAEVFSEYLSPRHLYELITFVKTNLEPWKNESFIKLSSEALKNLEQQKNDDSKELMQEFKKFLADFMQNKEIGYPSKYFKNFLAVLKENNDEELKASANALKKIEPNVAFELFFSGTCLDFLHGAHHHLGIRHRKGEVVNGKTVESSTFEENRVQLVIKTVENFERTKNNPNQKLIAGSKLIEMLGKLESTFATALRRYEGGQERHSKELQKAQALSDENAKAIALQNVEANFADLKASVIAELTAIKYGQSIVQEEEKPSLYAQIGREFFNLLELSPANYNELRLIFTGYQQAVGAVLDDVQLPKHLQPPVVMHLPKLLDPNSPRGSESPSSPKPLLILQTLRKKLSKNGNDVQSPRTPSPKGKNGW